MRERNIKLKKRVEDSRLELKLLNIKYPRFYFAKKYKKYSGKEMEDKLNNLWYCKSFDECFTTELEAFVKFKKVQKI